MQRDKITSNTCTEGVVLRLIRYESRQFFIVREKNRIKHVVIHSKSCKMEIEPQTYE